MKSPSACRAHLREHDAALAGILFAMIRDRHASAASAASMANRRSPSGPTRSRTVAHSRATCSKALERRKVTSSRGSFPRARTRACRDRSAAPNTGLVTACQPVIDGRRSAAAAPRGAPRWESGSGRRPRIDSRAPWRWCTRGVAQSPKRATSIAQTSKPGSPLIIQFDSARPTPPPWLKPAITPHATQ